LAYFSSKSPPVNPNPGKNYSFLLAKHYYAAAPFPSFESQVMDHAYSWIK
jgi:hypothetical protein